MKLSRKRKIGIIAVLPFIITPLFLFGYTYISTRASQSQLRLPGTPVNETAFAVLIDQELDPAIPTGSYSTEFFRPYILVFNPTRSNLIDQDEAINASREFIPIHYWDYLEYLHWTRLDSYYPKWTIRFTSHVDNSGGYCGLVIVTEVNAVTGRIIRYHVHWNEEVDPDILAPPVEPDRSPLSRSMVEAKLIQFLSFHEYTLAEEMRLVETQVWPNETDASWYRFKFAKPTGYVIPDEAIQGVEARVDAVTGEVMDFSYSCLDTPKVSVEGVIDPDLVYDQIMKDVGPWSSFYDDEYLGAFLRFRMIEDTPIKLQLVWAFQFKDTEDGWPREVHRDAFDGSWPISIPLSY
ncbi:MAG: hypothetical protein ACW99U_18660 [Candidatus Thorarchaeota archaeon]|jgi:hypothetical protein